MQQASDWEEQPRLRVTVQWDGRQYFARCPQYDLITTGKTVAEAREAMWHMIQEYLALTHFDSWDTYYTLIQEMIDQTELPLDRDGRAIN